MSRRGQCPHPHPKGGGPCRGALRDIYPLDRQPGWSAFECETCGRRSDRNDSLKPKQKRGGDR